MGSWWRSEEMLYISLIMTEEAALSCIRELGILGCIQFVDLNPELTPFQREYVSNIKQCDEIERKIRYVFSEVKRLGIEIPQQISVEEFIANSRRDTSDAANNGSSGSGAYILQNVEAEETPIVFNNINKTTVELLVVENNKIQLFNVFEYHSKEDFLYYILFVFEQLKLDTETTPIELSGNIELEDELYNLLYNYVRYVNFINKEYPFSIADSIDKNNLYQYFLILNSFECE